MPERCECFGGAAQPEPARTQHRGSRVASSPRPLAPAPLSHFPPSDLARELPPSPSLRRQLGNPRYQGMLGGQSPRRDRRHSHGPRLARMTVMHRKTPEPSSRERDWSQCHQRSDSHGPGKRLLVSIHKKEEGASVPLLSGLLLPPPLKHISHPI